MAVEALLDYVEMDQATYTNLFINCWVMSESYIMNPKYLYYYNSYSYLKKKIINSAFGDERPDKYIYTCPAVFIIKRLVNHIIILPKDELHTLSPQSSMGDSGKSKQVKVFMSPRAGPKIRFKVLYIGSMANQVPFHSLMY